jgi:hypothetical protein
MGQGFTFVCRSNYVTLYWLYPAASGVGPGAICVGLAIELGTVSLAFGPNSAKRSNGPLTDPKAGRKPLFSVRRDFVDPGQLSRRQTIRETALIKR